MNLDMDMDTDTDMHIGMNKAFYMDTDHGHRRLAQSFEMALPRHFLKDLDVGKSLNPILNALHIQYNNMYIRVQLLDFLN
jgi:hypothetical protein